MRAITRPASRSIATDGYYQTARWIQDEIAKLPNVELQVHEFPIVVPVTKSATLTFADGSTERVYPFWAAGARLCSTPEAGIRGRLIYCGEGKIEQIPIGHISGQIAVVESTARTAWTRAISSGARAIIVLGTDDTNNLDLRNHDIRMPINLPRFYVPEGKLANDLRRSPNPREATLRASVSWETRTAINLYALVKPSNSDSSHRAALMLYAPFDSTSLVPDLAPGASQAVQTASALAMLRDFSRAPPDRPMLVCFSGADGIQLLGSRQMLMALAESPQTWWREMSELSQKQSNAYQARYRANEVRDRAEKLDVRRDRTTIERIVAGIELELKLAQDELFRQRAGGPADDSPAPQSELESRQATLHRLKAAFQNRPADLAKIENALAAREIIDRTIARMDELLQQHAGRKGVLDRRVELYQWLARAIGRNPEPADSDSTSRLIELVVGIDLSDRGTRIGPLTEGNFQRTTSIGDVQDYLSWLNRALRERAQWFESIRDRVDLEPPNQIRSPQSYLCASMPISTELTQAWGVPGLSFVTLDDQRLRRDTPTDTLEHLNVDAIVPQLRAVRTIIIKAASDLTFQGPADRKRRRASIPGQVVSLAPGKPVANLGRGGFLIAYHYVNTVVSVHPKLRAMSWTMGVRRNEMTACDADGNYLIEGLPRLHNDLQLFAVTAHRVDPKSGAITSTTDLGKQSGDISIYCDIKNAITPKRSLVFDCDQAALVDVIDPRFMQPLNEATLIDARREAEPQRFCFFLHDRFFAGFLEPGSRTAYAFRYGRIGNRLLMLNPPNGELASAGVSGGVSGFVPSELLANPLSLTTAQNFWALNDGRLDAYRRAGVSSSVIDSMHRDSASQLAQAKTALAQNHSTNFARTSELAWSNEARVYDAVRDLADDVVRGAIFLLLLCVPFAFCVERLLIGTPNVYRQITGSACIFAIMTAALWSFHPAFKISASPLIIVLAFAIIFMSLVVIVVLYNKFDVELKRIRSGRAISDDVNLRRVGVLANAVLLGIANMRRRP
ncbi:MAG: hypothetical protein H7Z14_10435, partial [Anaerolineae bacterium]|nr:hypothetical protein [Phycisphaerae bacterium]